ncbi:MAG: HD domain-containing protein [Patescibacteria group bacterium]
MEAEHREKFAPELEFARRLESEPDLAFLPELYGRFPKAEFYLVGGAVRDQLLGRQGFKDYDLVVRNVTLEELSGSLAEAGSVDLVGRNFGVLKFWPKRGEAEPAREAVDIAWPRTETAGGSGGYRDFDVQADPALPIERDLARRDLTVNAIAWDMRLQRFIDPYGGREDIRSKTLRAVGEPAARFQEDYSRMLRVARLACQLGFTIEERTWDAVRALMPRINDERAVLADGREISERVVPYETIAKELFKAFDADPVRALDLFEQCGALFQLMPELRLLSTCEQSPDHHREGNVWTHTKLAMAKLVSPEFAARFPGERAGAETALAVLLHDIGKPATAKRAAGGFTFYNHEEVGSGLARQIADRLKLASAPGRKISSERLAGLVKNHLFPNMVRVDEVRKTTLAKYFLADRDAGRELLHLAFADASASLPGDGEPDLSNLDRLLTELSVLEKRSDCGSGSRSAQLLTGREVMETLHLAPGPEIGRVLEEVKEAQLKGQIATPDAAKSFIAGRYGAK